MTDEHVIDIRRYLDSSPTQEEPGAFGTWGGTGERSRFALPVWRSIYLAKGDWGGIVHLPEAPEEGQTEESGVDLPAGSPFFILDLKTDPARTDAPLVQRSLFVNEKAPMVLPTDGGGVAILLGKEAGRWWFLLIQGEEGAVVPEDKDLETMLFLAGECSGLLFLRELAGEISRRD